MKFDKIPDYIRQNVNAWMRYFQAPNACYKLEGGLYAYSGVCNNTREALSDLTTTTTSVNNGGMYGGLSNLYPFVNLNYTTPFNNFSYQKSTLMRLSTLTQHYRLPVYENIVKSLFDNVVSSIVSGEITCNIVRFARESSKVALDINESQIKRNGEKLAQEVKQQIVEKIQNADIDPKVKEKVLEATLQSGQQALEMQLKAQLDEIDDRRNKLELDNKEEELIQSIIMEECNRIIKDPLSRSMINRAITQFFAGGFSVIGLTVDENNSFQFLMPDRPDCCFASPFAKSPIKSDGRFFGEIRCYDKYEIMSKYYLTEDECDALENFQALYSYGNNSNLDFFNTYNLDVNSYKILCHYYSKQDNGKVKHIVCDNTMVIYEHEINIDELPFCFIDSDEKEHKQNQASVFSTVLPIQYELNIYKALILDLSQNAHGGKFITFNCSEDAVDKFITGRFNRASYMNISTDNQQAGSDSSNEVKLMPVMSPHTVPAIEIPQGILMKEQQCYSAIHNHIFGVMSNNGMQTNQSSVISNISGVAMERMDAKQSDLVRKGINIVENSLSILFQNIFMKNFFKVYGKDPLYKILFKNLDDKKFNQITQKMTISIEISINTEAKRSKNRQQILDSVALMNMLGDGITPESKISLGKTVISSYFNETDLQSKGELSARLENALDNQEQRSDPSLEIAQQELQFKQSELQLKAEDMRFNQELEKMKLDLETAKIELDQKIILIKEENSLMKSYIDHPSAIDRTNVRREIINSNDAFNAISDNILINK